MNEQENVSGSENLDILRSLAFFDGVDWQGVGDVMDAVTVQQLAPGEVLFQQGQEADALYVVVDGLLLAVGEQEGALVAWGDMGPGDPVGEIEVLARGRRTATVTASQESTVVRLPRAAYERLLGQFPVLLVRQRQVIHSRLLRDQLIAAFTRLFGSMDPALLQTIEAESRWVWLQAGDVLFEQGSPSDDLYVLVSGRLQTVVTDPGGQQQVVGEVSSGETVGEMGVITHEPRVATLVAMRDSSLVALSRAALERIMAGQPRVAMAISRVLVNRLRRATAGVATAPHVTSIALLPLGADVPLEEFGGRLAAVLGRFGSTHHLTSHLVDAALGAEGRSQVLPDNPQSLRVATWLDQQESQHRFLVYQAEPEDTPWTRRCLNRADRVLLIGRAASSPALTDLELALEQAEALPPAQARTLVLLQPAGQPAPRGTAGWLQPREVHRVHHVRGDSVADIERLGRILAGRAVGLVLGGGGARGMAHFGIIKALQELDIPIDMVGGTSFGGGVAALYAMGLDIPTMVSKTYRGTVERSPTRSYTVPVMSLIDRKRLDDAYMDTYGDVLIEDMWLDFFSVACDITSARLVVMKSGPAWKAVRATQALPGLFPPLVEQQHLYIDGGLMDNVPVDVMRRLCGGQVIAVDVSPDVELTTPYVYEELPSPWRVLGSRVNPMRESVQVFSIFDVLMRAMVVNSTSRRNELQQAADLYLKPPVDQYGMLQFQAFEELRDIGYRYAMERRQDLERFRWTSD